MSILVFSIVLLIGAYFAGLLGSLTGLGGGVIVIPLLTLAFGVDIRYAIGAALLASIATCALTVLKMKNTAENSINLSRNPDLIV